MYTIITTTIITISIIIKKEKKQKNNNNFCTNVDSQNCRLFSEDTEQKSQIDG